MLVKWLVLSMFLPGMVMVWLCSLIRFAFKPGGGTQFVHWSLNGLFEPST